MERRFLAFSLLLACALSGVSYANYWFQFGARGGVGSEFNQGASVSIQTVLPQNISDGSPAFWVGEDLANGAFLQIGYMVANATGAYPSYCSPNGCSSYEELKAGQAEWFYEYFSPSSGSNSFLGAVGPANSVGANGVFNTYGFYYDGSTKLWNLEFNGQIIGNVDLQNGSSGVHSPVAFGELANASSNRSIISQVIMQNLSSYANGRFMPVADGHAYIGFGVGSKEGVIAPYGVKELDNRINYFAVGSGLPKPANGTELWSLGYNLDIQSNYGNISSKTNNIAYSQISISAPRIINLSSGSRAVFAGWQGSGFGSYTGTSNSTAIAMDSNITERAQWQLQYYLDVSSAYAEAHGAGWYNANSTAAYGLSSGTFYKNSTARNIFMGWENSTLPVNGTVMMGSPVSLRAEWQQQYYVNVSSGYGNVSGGGWDAAFADTEISASPAAIPVNATSRYAFSSWSNGAESNSISLYLTKPVTLIANYRKQYLYEVQGVDGYGNRIPVQSFYANGQNVSAVGWYFAGETYNITRAYYKGISIPISSAIRIDSSSASEVSLPVYNVEVVTKDIFGMPVNSSVQLKLSNGTTVSAYTGSSGELVINDVPYGGAAGTATASAFSAIVQANNGTPVHITFVTLFDLLAFAIIAAAAIAFYVYSSRKMHPRQPERQAEEVGFGTGMKPEQ